MQQPRHSQRQWGLTLALGVSVLLHTLFLILSLWIPIGQDSAAGEPLPREIRFSFAQPPDEPEPEPEPERRIGDEAPPAAVSDERLATAAPSFGEVVTPDLPEPLTVQQQQAIAERDAPGTLRPEQVEIESPIRSPAVRPELEPEELQPWETAQPDFEQEDDADYQESEGQRPDGDPRQQRTLDLRDAMRDFGASVSRQRAREQRSAAAKGEPQTGILPDPSALPASGFGVGALQFTSGDYDWSDYARQIYIAIWRAWHNRLHQTTDEFEKWAHEQSEWMLNHRSQVRFVIERSGAVTGITVESPAGCQPLDLSASDALTEVILPPLPGDFPRGSPKKSASDSSLSVR